jgi:L-fuconolactonase
MTLIVDSQVHVFAADRPERPWVPGGRDFAHRDGRPFLPEDLLGEMDVAGVDRALLVSPTWEGTRNDLVIDAAVRHPDRFGAIVRLPLDEPAPEALAELWQRPGVYGARAVFARQTEPFLPDGTADWFWETAEALSIPVMVYAPRQLAAVRTVAERHPGLRLALCHAGIHWTDRGDQISSAIDEATTLADLPTVSVKISSLPKYIDEPAPFPSLEAPIMRLVTAFGAHRSFWGSDLTALHCTYSEVVDLYRKGLPGLSDADRELVLGQALGDWLAWPAVSAR